MQKIKFYLYFIQLFLFPLIFVSQNQNAFNTIILENDSCLEKTITPYLKVYSDKTGKLKFEDISSTEFSNNFINNPFDQISQNVKNGKEYEVSNVYWVKFKIYNHQKHNSQLFLIFPGSDFVDLYYKQNNELIHHKTGELLTLNQRDYNITANVYLNVDLTAGYEYVVYARLFNNEKRSFEVCDAYISSKDFALGIKFKNRFINALFMGIFLIMVVYNLILFFTIKEKTYLYYVLYIFNFGLAFLINNNYAFEFFWPNHPEWGRRIPTIISLSAVFFFYILFAKEYLNLKYLSAKWDKLIIILLITSIIIGPLSIIDVFIINMLASLLMFIIFILLLIPAVITWKKGNKSSLYFILGNLMLLFSLIGFFTVNVVLENGSYAKWVLQIGATLEIIMFSIGIGNKVTGLVKEKAEAQEEIIKQLKENEKIKDEANAQLENKVIERTAEVVKQKHLIEEKQKEILDSIHYAKRLQEAILPPLSFINEHLPNNFVLYQPKDVVAGDFYWAEMKDDKFFIAAADCTGHGVPGAMVSVVCSNALNRTVNEFGITDTGKILNKTRELVLETFAKGNAEVKDGMDISLLCIDKKNNKAFWSGANNPLWYIDPVTSCAPHSVTSIEFEKSTASGLESAQPEIKEIKADKQPIGKTDNPKPYTTHEIELKPGIQFYLFTDGYADQFGGPKGKKFKYKQLEELLLENANKNMQEQHQTLITKFSEWKGDLEQVDDVCVIGVRL